jgi:hypothetical protein
VVWQHSRHTTPPTFEQIVYLSSNDESTGLWGGYSKFIRRDAPAGRLYTLLISAHLALGHVCYLMQLHESHAGGVTYIWRQSVIQTGICLKNVRCLFSIIKKAARGFQAACVFLRLVYELLRSDYVAHIHADHLRKVFDSIVQYLNGIPGIMRKSAR